ncbi:hypothetical protein, partial [Achromobacter sp. 413638]|uniref:hypothetical protein n=1 Tax=Achromobacter sp. 413638 TaxID=3342385 RepID=UPI00370A043C
FIIGPPGGNARFLGANLLAEVLTPGARMDKTVPVRTRAVVRSLCDPFIRLLYSKPTVDDVLIVSLKER